VEGDQKMDKKTFLREVERRFTYQPPFGDQPYRYKRINEACRDLAELLIEMAPYSRELSLAITALEDVRMRANQAIATNERPPLTHDNPAE
jgi:hypothetical protein